MRRILRVVGCWLLVAGMAIAQTSYYELKLYSTSNKLVGGKDVDLYQGVTKIYDLSESATTAGVYYHNAVAHGEYDIYVNGSSWKTGIWIGAEKVSTVVDLFTMDASGPDTLEMTGHIKATSFEGDGSKLTGTGASGGLVNVNDTNIGADSDSNGVGAIYVKTRGRNRLIMDNAGNVWAVNGIMIVGDAGGGAVTGVTDNSVQVHNDTSAYVLASRVYSGGSAARYAMMVADDYDNVIKFASSKTGTVPDGNDEWPMVFQIGSNKPVKIYEDNTIIIGSANNGSPAGVTSPSMQVHADTSAYMIASRIYGGGTGARYAMVVADDYDNVVKFSSSKTGTVPDGNDEWPMVFQIGSNKPVKIYEDNTFIVGSANNGSPAGVTSPSMQVHADTSAYVIASRIYGGGTGARYAMMVADDYDNVIKMASSKTGTVPDGDEVWPMVFQIGSDKIQYLYTDSVSIEGDLRVSGTLKTKRRIAFDATAFYPHAANGPALSVKNGQVEVYEFALNDSAMLRQSLLGVTGIDSVTIDVQCNSTAGDSARFYLRWRGVDVGDVETAAFPNTANVTKDLGTTANAIVRFKYTGITGLNEAEDVTWQVYRAAAAANEESAVVAVRRMIVWYH